MSVFSYVFACKILSFLHAFTYSMSLSKILASDKSSSCKFLSRGRASYAFGNWEVGNIIIRYPATSQVELCDVLAV